MSYTRKNFRLAYFWPGLPQLWNRGSWAGLLVAVGFTALLNVLLLSTLVFSEWLSLETQLAGGGVLAVVWLLARWQSRAERRHLGLAKRAATSAAGDEGSVADGESGGPLATKRDEMFREAQGRYLQNDWVATEQLLLKLLKLDARDVESRLMLATLWRHQGRSAEALRQLDRLERFEAASQWQHEVAAERMAINDPDRLPDSSNHDHDEASEANAAGDDQDQNRLGAPKEPAQQPSTENQDHRDDPCHERRAA